MLTITSRRIAAALGTCALVASATTFSGVADAGKGKNTCDKQANNTLTKVLDCLSPDGVFEHLQAFQDIADANDDPLIPGSRAAGTAGYQGSVDYVVDTLESAGWSVALDEVQVNYTATALVDASGARLATGVFSGSAGGSVTGTVIPVDLAIGNPAASTSGCEATDFGGIDWSGENDIALVQRGACFFSTKAVNAEAAGAEAIIIFNQGTPGREGPVSGNATALPDGSPSNIGIPMVGAGFADGVALSSGDAVVTASAVSEPRIDYNVIAELPGDNDDNVVMAGAHLDSVQQGPGIQDNGSGSAALLEFAQVIRKLEPVNTIRLAWWAGEEQGLVGSNDYVANLSPEELDRIAAYLNFDMISSPNFIFGVYDADESSFPAPGGVPIPNGSIAIENLFEIYFTWQGIPYEDTQFSGRSDYQAFINNNIPSSGLFTGAEVLKTAEQAAIWGGVAGEQFDQCYHLACDTIDNPSAEALGVNTDAIGFAMLTLAYSTESVNRVVGEPVPGAASLKLPTEPAGPEGTFVNEPDGGDDHDHGADDVS